MGNQHLLGAALLVVALLVAVVLWPTPGPAIDQDLPVPASANVAAAPTPVHVEDAPSAVPRAPAPAATKWLERLFRDDESLVPDEGDSFACILRGRLTVRQHPSVHPTGVEIRLTRALMDTVIPTDAGEQDEPLPILDGPAATTDAEGRFALRLRATRGELFFLIDHAGPWMDFQRVRSLPRPGQDLDLGEIYVDERGGITGRVFSHGEGGVEGAIVMAVDDPLLDSCSELDELRERRDAGADRFRADGTLIGGPVPGWLLRRDRFLPFPRCVTDGKGRFHLEGVRPGEHDLFVQVLPSRQTLERRKRIVAGSGRVDGVLVAAGRTTQLEDVWIEDASWAKLTFVDEDDEPWVGAGVSLVHNEAGYGSPAQRTNADGEAWVHACDEANLVFGFPGGGPWIRLHTYQVPEHLLTREAAKEATREAVARVARELGPGAALETRRAAVTQAILAARHQTPMPTKSQRRRVFLERLAAAHGRRATIEVRRPNSLAVCLTDPSGAAIPNGRVRLFVQTRAFRALDRALPKAMQPTARGFGTHRGAAPCEVIAVASAPGFAPAVARIPAGSRSATLTMLPLRIVTVRVHDHRGRAVPGAAVRIQAHACVDHRFHGAQWDELANDRVFAGLTDDRGRLEVAVWDTELSFAADHPSYSLTPGPRLRPRDGQRIDLLLRSAANLAGQLLYHGRPAPAGFRLRCRLEPPGAHELVGSGWLSEHLAVTDENGGFALRGLTPGLWHLQPELPPIPGPGGPALLERDWLETRVSLEEGQEMWRIVEAELEPLATPQIAGRVRIDGLAVAGAVVRVRGRAPPEQLGERLFVDRRVTTDHFGDFAFAGLCTCADYEVRVDVPDQGRLQFLCRQTVRAPGRSDDEPSWVDIDVNSGRLQLYVSQSVRPFANRMLRLQQILEGEPLGARWELLTGPNGECWVGQLPAGTWRIQPLRGGGCEPDEFTIQQGQTSTVLVSVTARRR